MAVYGIGAMFGGTDDQTQKFIDMGVACIGWSAVDAPSIHRQMASLKMGDIIFIKSFAPSAGLHVKAAGVVTDPQFRLITQALGWGIDVRWRTVPDGRIDLGTLNDHADFMRRGSLYEEFNPTVINTVLDILVPE
jgi:hypothetical protein